MRGSARLRPRNWSTAANIPAKTSVPGSPGPLSHAARKRVLFVCIGNSCRSQMAEGFARVYGGDTVDAQSAGLNPASIVQPLTVQVMLERNVRLDGQFPKGLEAMARQPWDVIVNMSGQRLPLPAGARVLDWPVADPIGRTDAVYRNVAAQIEGLVMRLVLDLRSGG